MYCSRSCHADKRDVPGVDGVCGTSGAVEDLLENDSLVGPFLELGVWGSSNELRGLDFVDDAEDDVESRLEDRFAGDP